MIECYNMLQIWKRYRDRNRERKRVLSFLPSRGYQETTTKREKNSAGNSLGSYSNDILVSSAGQAKIAALDSCLKLVSSDFIVF